MNGATLRQALAHAARGWPVFPCQAGQKTPATAHGYRDATTDPDQITAWFTRNPHQNLAIATGAPGPDVLDVDDHGPAGNGYPALAKLSRAGLLDSAAAYVRTPNGGLHAYFTGSAQRNGHLPAHHLDFRSRGGYVLAPPSQIDGKPYHLIRTLNADGALDWSRGHRPARTASGSSPGPSRAQPRTVTSATWPGGSPASSTATATRACSGPPTAPSKPTPPPTSAPWPPPPARPAWTTRKSPAP